MANKYLSIEEAAAELGMTTEDLRRLREKGELRGFADRGTWKFRLEDIEAFRRVRQTDSDPEVPLLAGFDDSSPSDDLGGSSILSADEDALGEQPTTIRKRSPEDSAGDGAPSDSDVRLLLDDSLLAGDSAEDVSLPVGPLDSDSDVALTDQESDSDSDVLLVGSITDEPSSDSDSDVALVESDSESDVKLLGSESSADVDLSGFRDDIDEDEPMFEGDSVIGIDEADDILSGSDILKSDSDSDVRLVQSDSESDIQLAPTTSAKDGSDSDVKLVGPGSESDSDSDIALMPAADETIAEDVSFLSDEDESSILRDGSGIGLAEESGISLAAESGISLENADDSGISLDLDEDDSGISLAGGEDSGISLLADDDDEGLTLADASGLGSGIPMLADDDDDDTQYELGSLEGDDSADDLMDTQLQVPALSMDDDESDFELGSLENESSDQSVLLFDDEDDIDERQATVVKKRDNDDLDIAADEFDLGDDEEDTFDLEGGGDEEDEFESEDDLELADDVLGEDDELDDIDVFDADDEDFDDEFETGETHAEFLPSMQVAAPPADWGGLVFGGLLVGTLAMAVCGMVMFDLVRSIWYWHEPSPFAGPLIEIVSGLF